MPGPTIPVDTIDTEPSMYRFHRRLASFSRMIRFDHRGVGLSSRVPSAEMLGPKFWAADAVAVMDAVGCERATVFASGFTATTALLDNHDTLVRHEIQRFGGQEVNTAGDGFVATFNSPSAAIACAADVVGAVRVLGIEVRVGIHAGEVEVRGARKGHHGDVAGMAVHIGARVMALAEPGEVLVSSTVRDIVTGSKHTFAERGDHDLKGVPGRWRLYALVSEHSR